MEASGVKKFDYEKEEIIEKNDSGNYVKRFYEIVGKKFPIKWPGESPCCPEFAPDDLPDGVTETDVKDALIQLKEEGLL
jgi:hypothetical protein